ncbi:Predicted dehydrogenase [Arenibacter nanhaiticus]|uniref:Predicted dehydrogenase n=1 Tax=Arenibacter nanhaiticus TaxID=558155 RepID=A0A1M6E8P9_9FLAO|nr:Gfo/Idh/MocA family oxidoreductase [Arenibacter nanhaiticus]SHI81811.1 Predicted dehydrogenase [Arenibacter nanhaiticus]
MDNTKKTIRTGLLSFGMSGKVFHAPFLKEHQGFSLEAVVERSEKKAHHSYPEIKSYDAVDALIADPNIELVVVNTPNASHFEFALKALQAGKHVLVEKPITVTSDQAKKLYAAAKRHNVHIFPYQNRRFDSDFLSIQKVLDSGKLGRLVEVHMRYDRYRHHISPKAHKETPVPGSGLLNDLGPHLLDAVLSLFGNPISWTKTLGQFRPNTQVDDYAHIHLLYPNDVQVFLTMSMLVVDEQPAFILNGTKGSYLKHRTNIQEIQLSEGMRPGDPLFGMEDPSKYGILTTIDEEGTRTRETIPSDKSTYLNLFEYVYQTIRNGKPYPVTEEQVIKQLEILES